MIFDAPNRNRFWAELLVEELVRCGVSFFSLAPGSRSTPLVTAVAAHPEARAHMHFDERGAAFLALGYARATGRGAAWVTTSGTAVANGLPAVVEAAMDGVPLLLLTADRPPELRDTGANQAIDQVKLFGDYVRWQFDLPVPDPAPDPAMVLTTVDQAVYRACRAPRGPVHLNVMFREPLAPEPDGGDFPAEGASLRAWYARGTPYTTYTGPAWTTSPPGDFVEILAGVERGLVVAGRLGTAAEGQAVRRLAEALGWPLLPDVGSQVRLGREHASPVRVDYFDLLLAQPGFAETHRPEAVLHFGRRPTSKRLARLLETTAPPLYALFQPDPFRHDPAHRVTHRFEVDLAAFATALATAVPSRAAGAAAWLAGWKTASDRVGAWLNTALPATGLSEPAVAHAVTRLLPPEHSLVLAASMPVRDADVFAAADGPAVPVFANRGASGIDGTVATAAGVALGRAAPATLLIGDLALLHDLNSLALLRRAPVVVVVLNNDGGGIFHFLPIARHTGVFEPFFGTPHGLGFEHAARLFDLPYHRPATLADFEAAYREACATGQAALIEVVTDRRANRALHDRLQKEAGEALA
ncbi:2-succinyl-5-enolpyruvyl-6-hydroxy-3-cyclohexene-1-carboxylic-acid synthase [Rhodocaloribacter litoris]|uniref:2-succinyl-5-enolpyruvyl-6-hydroxy-3- cyclohexene-1-carboxylic-acid synthase n=1 Tax=Rhodocaloribacter litoris TaxID=2558931 RepID=UPI001423B680|nr:2-succinyl-5-enolpyruvyl-6-hydroxy-3-cyclohexene-1-carboxylic-acid synthase [Rhodocaloribacter litoris]QXD15255.1 2-succinyl-5-enolpyruvyl-6-hydroxy-3-cyclohexene-1-carboxylic-acid synthase [Rhodocaloribacter litoris]GIV62250.1 MAG: 2-succinyl-5-enolpyruvyl-6-hydroxy-3-cyclohexene-1-carboxylate synthase [Rhodothermaceae bacterium]